MKQRVIVIGNSFATRLGVIRSLANTDCEIVVVDIGFHKNKQSYNPIDYYSKYVDKYLFFERSEGREGLVHFLIRECADKSQKAVLVPTNDFCAVTLDENRNVLKEYFLFSHIHNTEGAVSHWMNKMTQKELASQIGLNVAKAIILRKGEKQFAIPSGIDYPCFTKPLASIGGGKRCLKRCDSEKALAEVLENAEKSNIEEILIEENIKIEKEYAVLGFSDGNDVIIPGIIEFVEGCKSHPGVALKGKIKPITCNEEDTIRLFKQLIQEIGFIGIFDIDFVESADKIYFVELNLRIGGSAYAVTKMGCSLPAMYVKYMTGKSIKEDTGYVQSTKTYLNERMLMDDWMSGERSTFECIKLFCSSDIHFIFDEDDPRPQLRLKKEFFRKLINPRRIVKRIKCVIKK